MSSRIYTDEEHAFVEEHYMDMSDVEIGEHIGRSRWSVKTHRHINGLYKYHHSEVDWTEEELDMIREKYPNTSNKEILELLPGRSLDSLYKKAHQLGVKKTDEFRLQQNRKLGEKLGELGKGHRFKKGQTPFNKGMKQEDFMDEEAIEASKATRFKNGHKPHNTLFNGAVRIRRWTDGSKYMFIRIEEGEWQEYHQYQYEKHIGPIPDGHIVTFKDGNSLNCTPENLEAITRAEHASRNRNPEAAIEAFRKYREENGTPSQRMTDAMVAHWLAGGDKDLKEHLISERQDLIRVARANYKLKREIREHGNN